MKYVIFQYNGEEVPVIFASHIPHQQILLPGSAPVSAGYIELHQHGPGHVWGENVALNLNCRPMDADIINRWLDHRET